MGVSPTIDNDGPPPTPPHLPTHGVYMADEKIRDLINVVFEGDGRKIEEITQLPSGRSFNNRIYFINFMPKNTTNAAFNSDQPIDDLVLKLPGWNFDIYKIQNEVACHLLLEKNCFEIPIPRVVAWCEGDGKIARVVRGGHSQRKTDLNGGGECVQINFQEDPHRNIDSDDQKQGAKTTSTSTSNDAHVATSNLGPYSSRWILLTKLPGQPVDPATLSPQSQNTFTLQLAKYMSQWRQMSPPFPGGIGNLRIISDLTPPARSSNPVKIENEIKEKPFGTVFNLPITVSGLLIGVAREPLPKTRSYFTRKMLSGLDLLKSIPYYASNRDTVTPLVTELLDTIFPQLSLFQDLEERPVFTHYDLSPRNILVSPSHGHSVSSSTSQPHSEQLTNADVASTNASNNISITGILDLEFAGFFPAAEEFTNTMIDDPTAWPSDMWEIFLNHLHDQGVVDGLPPPSPRPDQEQHQHHQLEQVESKTVDEESAPASGEGEHQGQRRRRRQGNKETTKKWEQACALVRIHENVAPWQLGGGGVQGEELESQLKEAREVVEANVALLKKMINE